LIVPSLAGCSSSFSTPSACTSTLGQLRSASPTAMFTAFRTPATLRPLLQETRVSRTSVAAASSPTTSTVPPRPVHPIRAEFATARSCPARSLSARPARCADGGTAIGDYHHDFGHNHIDNVTGSDVNGSDGIFGNGDDVNQAPHPLERCPRATPPPPPQRPDSADPPPATAPASADSQRLRVRRVTGSSTPPT